MSDEPKDYAEMLFKSVYGEQKFENTQLNVERMAWVLAAASSAQHFIKDFPKVTNYGNKFGVLHNALKACSIPGLILEFGVATGFSIKQIASTTSDIVHGFDSFEGLPEDWSHIQKAGRYSTGGKIPDNLPPNVQLYVGLFDKTLPQFLLEHTDDQIRFLHVDSDIYSSAKTVLHKVQDKIVPGTVIVFDDYFNYPNWENGESKAWREFVAYRHVEFDYIGWAAKGATVAVKIKSVMKL